LRRVASAHAVLHLGLIEAVRRLAPERADHPQQRRDRQANRQQLSEIPRD
jgi:hypothetical protein